MKPSKIDNNRLDYLNKLKENFKTQKSKEFFEVIKEKFHFVKSLDFTK